VVQNIISEMEFEKGMIKAWEHMIILCKACIKAHKERLKELKKKKRESHDSL